MFDWLEIFDNPWYLRLAATALVVHSIVQARLVKHQRELIAMLQENISLLREENDARR